MCGISGFFDSTPKHSAEEMHSRCLAMVHAMRHRGPDADGVLVEAAEGIALGHARLSIIDPSPCGAQPMRSRDGRFSLVFNGEIYNAAQLRPELSHPDFEGHSDTRVLLEWIAEFGLAATLPRLSGMFAFAFWDHQEKRLSLARDPMGKKPLYYGEFAGSLFFASELQSLRAHPDFPAELNADAAALFLKNSYITGPHSIYRGVQKLKPGHYVEFSATQLSPSPRPFWSLRELHQQPHREYADPVAACEEVISKAVQSRLVSDVPLGAFLSGGIDSSLVVSMMCQHLEPSSIQSFALGFQEEKFNEAPHARAIAEHLGTQHHEFILTPEKALETVPELIDVYDEPFADTSQLPTVILSRFTRQQVTVALSGDGGDELFGGYNRYFKVLKLAQKTKNWPGRDMLLRLATRLPQHRFAAIARSADRLLANGPIEMLESQSSRILNPLHYLPSARQVPPAERPPASDRDALEDLLYHDVTTWLADDILVKTDRASMSCGLEVRCPLLDKSLVELAWSLPSNQRTQASNPKFLLKELLARQLPRALFERPKSGFAVPIAAWLSGPLRPWAEAHFSTEALNRSPLLDAKAARQLWSGFLKNPKKLARPTWNLLMLQAWLDRH